MAKRMRIGLLGLGTVGQGVAKLVLDGGDGLAARSGFRLELARVADIDIDRPRDVAVDRSLMTTDALSVCTSDDIDVVVDSGATETVTFTFDQAGTFQLICIPHERLGMVGTITVR